MLFLEALDALYALNLNRSPLRSHLIGAAVRFSATKYRFRFLIYKCKDNINIQSLFCHDIDVAGLGQAR